jgi:hypothetical protein
LDLQKFVGLMVFTGVFNSPESVTILAHWTLLKCLVHWYLPEVFLACRSLSFLFGAYHSFLFTGAYHNSLFTGADHNLL